MRYNKSIYRRFMAKVQICKHGVRCTKCCWLWVGARFKRKGREYGQFSITPYLRIRAHVFMFEWEHQIYEHDYICHSCDTPPCCQPSHLWEGTQKENIIDAAKKGRLKRKGEMNPNALLTNEDIELIFYLHSLQWAPSDIARYMNMKTTSNNIGKIIHGVSWRHFEFNQL